METKTLVLIIAAAILALGIACFQYIYKTKHKTSKYWFLAFLRFLSVFLLLILLINPTIKQKRLYTEKPKLIVALDNSSSVQHLNQSEAALSFVSEIKNQSEINDRFDLQYYSFAEGLQNEMRSGFNQKQTNISKTLDQIDQIYKNTNAATLLITDGNQTYGKDYQFTTSTKKQAIYPVVLGDSTIVVDTKIERLNVNRYAYLKNKFPIEIITTYSGSDKVDTKLKIIQGNTTVYSKDISFSKEQNSQVINLTLPANKSGVKKFKALLVPVTNENNTINNSKTFAVEIIDQKTNAVIISDIIHPDIGALKRVIESNERRKVTIVKPHEVRGLSGYQFVILYQPNTKFNGVYTKLKTDQKNYLTITGAKTDWLFLNRIQDKYKQEITRQTEYYIPRFNPNYNTFLTSDLGFEDYPPLVGTFGQTNLSASSDYLLYRSIGGISTEDPLLITLEQANVKEAVLFGEGIWRWRAHSYLEEQSFETFDNFFGKLIQYLSSNKPKSRLNTLSESFYYGNSSIKIQAEYFTKNYEFDARANLNIVVKNKKTSDSQSIPMVLKSNVYEVELSNFPAGEYSYTVLVRNENIKKSGEFTILEYDVEQQFLNADVTKLKQLATNTNGKAYYVYQKEELFKYLMQDKRYQTVQKSKESVVSIIDWKYLLGVLLCMLALEWFIRKYKGLI